MRRVFAFGMLTAVVAMAACSEAKSENAGPRTTRNFPVAAFKAIEVAGPYDVQVSTGGNPAVSATGPQQMIEHMVVEVRGDRLTIRPEEQHGMFRFGWHSNGNVRVQVTVPQLEGASIAGSGDIRVNQIKGQQFEGSVAGSGNLGVDQLEVQTLRLSIAGSGDVRATNGRAQSAKYEIAGSGGINARGLETQMADVSIAGSGSVMAHATTQADVSIMGSGNVEVTGGAKCNLSKHGSGSLSCG